MTRERTPEECLAALIVKICEAVERVRAAREQEARVLVGGALVTKEADNETWKLY